MPKSINKSHFTEGSIVSNPVEAEPFVPGKLNAFPKYVDAIGGTDSELWLFDAFSEKDHSALVIGFTRGIRPPGQEGFRVQVLGLWPDKSTWSRDFFFPESIITETEEEGVTGTWRDEKLGSSMSWSISDDGKKVQVIFNVPDVATGKLAYTAPPGYSGFEIDPSMGPQYNSVCALPGGWAEAEVDFEGGRRLALKPDGHHRVHGGFDHGWSKAYWSETMTESLYMHAYAGPYTLQMVRIFDKSTDKVPYVVATLFRDGQLICAPKRVVGSREEAEKGTGDALILAKAYGDDGLTGAFRDRNVGYRIEWYRGGVASERWAFNTRHETAFWNLPTSPPGPNATGNSGFIDSLTGGAEGEGFQGASFVGQCQFP